MSAPKRWLEDGGGATCGERELLRVGRAHDPPPDAKAAVWASLLTQLPPIPPLPGASGSAPGGAAAGAKAAGSATIAAAVGGGLLKSALNGAGSAIALIATYTAVTPSQPASPQPPEVQTAAPPIPPLGRAPASVPGPQTPSAPTLDEAPTTAGTPAITDAPGTTPSAEVHAAPLGAGEPLKGRGAASIGASSSGPTAKDREPRLLEESRRLTEARDTLRRGDASGALARLEELQRAVPGGILGQEREALVIEALARSGRGAEAQSRARAFLQAYPQSPHATRVEAFAR